MIWLWYQVAPRARGASLWMASAALRVLERIRRYSGLFELGGSFRSGSSEQPIQPRDRENYLHALERLSGPTKGK